MNERPIGIWLWLVLVVEVNATWIGMDLWLRAHRDELLTTEFREGLHSQIWGPLITGLLAFTVAAFVWHMYLDRSHA